MIIQSTTKPENGNPAVRDDKGDWHRCSKAVREFLSTKKLPVDCDITIDKDADEEDFIVKAKPKFQTDYKKPVTADKYKAEKPAAVDWDRLALGKCKYGFLIELMKLGKTLQEAEPEAEAWAKASMRIVDES